MKLHRSTADLFVPDGADIEPALRRITHLGIGAHHDDLEFMAFHGIIHCFGSAEEWFGGVTCTDGCGSARTGPFAHFTDEQMHAIRRQEQNAAALIGRYGVMIQLDHPSRAVQSGTDSVLREDLQQILKTMRPRVVYTHNPADKHETHVAVAAAAVQALRALPDDQRPEAVYGCEVWRDLDWLPDEDKVPLDVSGHDTLAAALTGVFDSQIAGGKRYDLATVGRRRANATFFHSHEADTAEQMIFAINLTPLVGDESIDVVDYVCSLVAKFENDVRGKLTRHFRKTS